ncbi:gluconolaconase [Paractinoplanes abujensis]|uniref:Glucose/arabinose dehydrogenase n=1 Tax=Paractinoplanes abujensis TaxID=882441 RepID=A0A7W7CPD0_9ACTN|nr:gluconolaconase [Actinoplanes abujensis]MBB4692280.1 glucose/arabinose dehydrogenase [Actinoplanes abujensis]GID24240.1 gluconolaconase [Actinoplanes abujensis]
MRSFVRVAVAAGLLAGVAACSDDASSGAPKQTVPASAAVDVPALVATRVQGGGDDPIQAPPGWTVSVWAKVPGARLLAWTPDKRLLVSRPESGDVLVLDQRGQAKPLVEGLNQPHGLAFDGDTLYVAESDQVDSFTYSAGAVSGKQVVIDNLPDEKSMELGGKYAHALKSVAVGGDGSIYVSIGSTGNVSEEDRDAEPERAAILRAKPGQPAETFARGVRNGTGLAIDPDGGLWTAVNNRDNIANPKNGDVEESYVNDHPLEPLARLTEGRDLGWPYCNPDPDLADGQISYTDRPFVRDVQTNPDGDKLDCSQLKPSEQGMGAHSAPLGLAFVTGVAGGYGDGALAGIHGSWNRQPPRPPEVSFFAWRDGTLGPQQTLLTGFQREDGSRWGRPVMAVKGPDGAIYVSDDQAGAIYRVTSS